MCSNQATLRIFSSGEAVTRFHGEMSPADRLGSGGSPEQRNRGPGGLGGAYNAAKGGVELLTKCLALDFAKENIRVNTVCPAWVETQLVQQFVGKLDENGKQEILNLHPLGRIGTPEDVAQAILYLASDESSWVTGTALVVDGGYMAGKE